MKRAIILVLDSVGVGASPDAEQFGDARCNTLGHIAEAVGGISLPALEALGLGCIVEAKGIKKARHPHAAYGKMREASPAKDTTTGHWEMAGLILKKPFPLYPSGFPPEVLLPFEEKIGRKTLGNKPASGTEIIKELGEEHMETGFPIVYTSGDSVFQIAAHEEVIPVEELYRMCEIARTILQGPHAVARVIARPFSGNPGSFARTERRRDFSLPPFSETILDLAKRKGLEVVAVGKIEDIFAGRGITESYHTGNNRDGFLKTVEETRKRSSGIIFTNLVDFDMLYGHRNNPQGYARALQEFDSWLPELLSALQEEDLLFITADHGNDPTTPGTDHTREEVPLLVHGAGAASASLGIRPTFADLGATVAAYLQVAPPESGESFLKEILSSPHKGCGGTVP